MMCLSLLTIFSCKEEVVEERKEELEELESLNDFIMGMDDPLQEDVAVKEETICGRKCFTS